MRKRIDPSAMIGQTFGSWTVLDYAGKNKSGHDQYLCRCKCGTERAVDFPSLRKGLSKSCGCGMRCCDLTGQTFGRWTVIKDAGQDKRGHDQYLCRCKCGTERVVLGPALRRGTSASCGCKRGKSTKRVTDDAVIGQKFGSWEVLKRAENTKKRVKAFSLPLSMRYGTFGHATQFDHRKIEKLRLRQVCQ